MPVYSTRRRRSRPGGVRRRRRSVPPGRSAAATGMPAASTASARSSSPRIRCSVKFFERRPRARRAPQPGERSGERAGASRPIRAQAQLRSTAPSSASAAKRHDGRRDRAAEDAAVVEGSDAAEYERAKPAGADRRCDRRKADADHGRDADARQDDARRERQLDAAEELPRPSCPCRPRPPRSAGSMPAMPVTVFAQDRRMRRASARE